MQKTLMICLLLLGLSVFPASADLINNGQFNPGVGGAFETVSPGGGIPGWNVTLGSVDWIGSYWQAPPNGGFSVDLNGLSQGAIGQDVNTSAGSYKLTFWLAGNPDGDPFTKSLKVIVSDVPGGNNLAQGVFTHLRSVSTQNMGWTENAFYFTAVGSQTNISFASQDAGSYGVALGDVSLVRTPEPAVYGTVAIGLCALSIFTRRRRRV